MDDIICIVKTCFIDETESFLDVFNVDGDVVNSTRHELWFFCLISLDHQVMKFEESNSSASLFVDGFIDGVKAQCMIKTDGCVHISRRNSDVL